MGASSLLSLYQIINRGHNRPPANLILLESLRELATHDSKWEDWSGKVSRVY